MESGEYASTEGVLEAAIVRLMLDPQPDFDEETLGAALERVEAEGDRREVRPWEDLKSELLAKSLRK